jgi:hypothetical protein
MAVADLETVAKAMNVTERYLKEVRDASAVSRFSIDYIREPLYPEFSGPTILREPCRHSQPSGR